MENNTILIILYFIFIFGIISGIIYLQILLSKSDNKWLGLIIPVIYFIFTLTNVAVFESNKIEKIDFGILVTSLISSNLPTIILILIYIFIRSKKKKSSAIKKMSIHDL